MKTLSILPGILLLATMAFAQMDIPKPGPELKKLDFFVGHWTSDGDVKPGPMGPGGKFTMQENSEWMDGGYFVVIHSKYSGGGMPNGSSTAYMGYDSQEKVYTYDEFNSMGEHTHSTGTLEGDNFTWMSDMKMGPQTMKGRFTMKLMPPNAYAYKFEVSPDGKDWSLVMDGKDTRQK
jgi:Protein of unknown function (DUF1579)